ncbi:MAG: metallophosphoesterase family protein, partial [Rhodothermales bacterium]
MRIAVISDIHSNLEALTAVLEEIDARGIEEIVCLGDVVGYGADPAACVDLVRRRCALTVLGNHDEAVARGDGEGYLPIDGRTAARHNHD